MLVKPPKGNASSASVLTGDGTHTLHSQRYGQSYHSTFGALTEARHVFIQSTQIDKRLQYGQPTRVLEIGFGLGLNALLSLDLACQYKTPLDYHAYEHDLLPASAIEKLKYDSLIATPQLHQQLVDCVASRNTTNYTRSTQKLNTYASLTLYLEDASASEFKKTHTERFHAIYLDAFSPDTNAECWSPEFLARLTDVLAEDGKLATYCVKGDVRRALLAAGLKVTKQPGPPGKREILVAYW